MMIAISMFLFEHAYLLIVVGLLLLLYFHRAMKVARKYGIKAVLWFALLILMPTLVFVLQMFMLYTIPSEDNTFTGLIAFGFVLMAFVVVEGSLDKLRKEE